jgi:hypothetical protein
MQCTAFTLAPSMLNTWFVWHWTFPDLTFLKHVLNFERLQSDGILLHRTGFNKHYSTVMQRRLWDIYNMYCNGWEKDLLSCQVHLEKDEKALYHLLDFLVLIISVYIIFHCNLLFFIMQKYCYLMFWRSCYPVVMIYIYAHNMLMLSFFCNS